VNAEFGLLQPYWLLLLPLPLVWLAWRRRHPRPWPIVLSPLALRYPLLSIVAGDDEPVGSPRLAAGDRWVAIAMMLAVIALAQPVRYVGNIASIAASEPVDLVVVAGTAISMTLRDYVIDGERVDRMAMTRHLLDRFVAEFQGQRIGLVVLSNPPALWLPLTTDKRVVRDAIARLRTVMIGRLSDTGAALQLVNDNFGDTDDKVVVLVTDGGL
jgi:Ca-activated chloride channel family protein